MSEEIFDMLLSFTDFLTFKQAMLDYKAVNSNSFIVLIIGFKFDLYPQDKEGCAVDLGGLVVSSFSSPSR